MSSNNVRLVHRLMTFVGVVTPLLLMFLSEGRVARSQAVQPIVPDTTMGNNNSLVTPVNGTNYIHGGTVIGNNNFHSFQDFSVPTGQSVQFRHPGSVFNIITRVTGSNASNIDGMVGARQLDGSGSQASLFFLNPNGIVFGKNARLDIGGSFYASTGNALVLTDASGNFAGSFGAKDTSIAPLLSIAPNVGISPYAFLSSARDAIGSNSISNQGDLRVNQGNNIYLLGGDITIDGGQLFAPSGQINLGGFNNEGWLMTYENFYDITKSRSNVTITNGATIGTYGSRDFGAFQSGQNAGVNIFANDLTLSGNSEINSGLNKNVVDANVVNTNLPAGNISINALNKVTIKNSAVRNPVWIDAHGNAGFISIVANNLLIQHGFIESDTRGISINNTPSNAGNIILDIRKDVTISDSTISSSTYGQGNSGAIFLSGSDIKLTNSPIFSTVQPGANGSGSIIRVDTNSLTLENSSVNTFVNTSVALEPGKTRSSGSIELDINGKLSLTNVSQIRNSVEKNAVGNASYIFIRAKDISLDNSFILSNSDPATGIAGNSGLIELFAPSGSINLTGGSQISTAVGSQRDKSETIENRRLIIGNAGNILITADTLTLDTDVNVPEKNSVIRSTNNGEGNTGNIELRINKLLSLKNFSIIGNSLETFGKGQIGTIFIDAPNASIKLDQLSQIRAAYESNFLTSGTPGSIGIRTKDLELLGGSQIISSYFRNFAGSNNPSNDQIGKIKLIVSNTIKIDGYVTPSGYSSGIFALTERNTSGNASSVEIETNDLAISNGGVIAANTFNNSNGGNVKITTNNLSLLSGGQIVTYSAFGNGLGGSVNIFASGKVVVNGSDPFYEIRRSNADTQIKAENSTDIVFDRVLNNGSQSAIETSTFGGGDSGYVAVVPKGTIFFANPDRTVRIVIPKEAKMPSLEISNYGYIAATTGPESSGVSGAIAIAVQSANISDVGRIFLDSNGNGDGGYLSLSAEQLNLDAGEIRATARSGNGGNLELKVSDRILLRNNSNITASSGQESQPGNGGNINIVNNQFLIAAPGENNDISANAFTGNGGKIDINSQAVIGLQFRKDRTPLNDITASSEGGGRDGVVSITSPGVDPGKDLGNLPDRPIDASNQIAQSCTPNTNANQFTVTGRGGLPTNPRDPITSDVIWQDTRNNPVPTPVAAAVPVTNDLPAPAQSWSFNKGRVTLVPRNQPASTALAACPTK